MNDKLIHDYWLATGNSIYPDFDVDIQTVAVCIVIFREQSPGLYGSFEQRIIDVLDVLA